MKNILWATDLSESSVGALKVAKELARVTGAKIHAFHVLPPPPKDVDTAQRAREVEERIKALLGDSVGHEIHISTQRPPYKAIVEAYRELECDLVAMGKSKLPDLEHYFAGPTARKLMHTPGVPVLLSRKITDDYSLKSILVATDLSRVSMKALEMALPLARAAGIKPTLLFIYEYIDIPPTQVERGEAEIRMKTLVEELFGPTELEYRVEARPDAAAGITEVATRENFSLVVMSTRGATGIEKWLVGSVAERVVRLLPLPLLLVKERE